MSSHFATLNGLRLHFVRHVQTNASQKYPVILLHGFNQTSGSWSVFASKLKELSFDVVALDQRGHGRSMHSPTKDYALDTMVADVAALCDSLQFDKFHLLGFSMGARVAARFAELHGRRVHKLVLVDYAPTSKRAASDDSEQRLSSVLAHFHQLTAMTFPTLDAAVDFMMTVNTRRTRENMMERLQDSMRQRDDGQWVFRVDPHVLDATISDRQHDMWTTIDAIGATCMFVHGADSEVVSLASALQVVSRLRKCRAYASIPNASHTVFGDRPEQFAAHVLPFLLDEQWRPSAAL